MSRVEWPTSTPVTPLVYPGSAGSGGGAPVDVVPTTATCACASGRLEDLRAAAEVLRGRQIKPGFQLHVVPTSQAIMAQAAREGLIATLVEAGAFISSPTCDYCYGRIATMADGQRAVSTGTLNTPGRMGSVDSEIYLCNAAVVAASAIEGRIADPRPYLGAA